MFQRSPKIFNKITKKAAAKIQPKFNKPGVGSVIGILLSRGWRHFTRKPIPYLLYLFQVVFIGIFGMILFGGLPRDYWTPDFQPIQLNISNRLGSILFIVANAYFTVIVNSSFSMVYERRVVLKEIKDGFYGKNVWFFEKIICDFFAFGVPIWLTAYPVRL